MLKLLKFVFNKWYFLLLTAISIIGQCYLQLMLPEYMGKITSLIMSDAEDKITQIWINGGWMMLISVGVIICCISQHFFGARVSSYVGKTLRERVFKKVNSLSITQFDSFGTATLITRTTNDIEQVKMYVLMSLRIVFMSPTYMIIGLIKTLTADAKLAIVLAITIPIILVGVIIMVAVTTPMFKKIQTKTDNLTVVLRGNLTGIRVIRAYNQQEKEVNKFDFANKDLTKTHAKVSRFLSFLNPITNIIFNLAYIGIFALGFSIIDGSNLITNGTVIQETITNVSVTAQYSTQIMSSFLMLAMIIIMLPQALASSNRINEVLNLEDPINDNELDKEINEEFIARKAKGVLKFDNVSFTYPGSSVPAISNISFETKPGKTVAIIGSTGSGKSTVVNLIPRLYDVSEGEITLDGFNIKNISTKELREAIGFTPQKALLFNGTIRSNIQFGKKDATDEEINKALEIAQAQHFISKLPEGLDAPVSQGGKNFSGGQKQRLTIARSIIKQPEILIFDDSFSALDFSTDAKLRYALKQNIKESAMVIVAQRVSSILDADTIVVLNDGQMVGKGTHAQLLKSCPVYQDIVKSQLDPEEVEKTIQMMKEATREEVN
ncbi:MAG: ABC transporter ATP-binding protein [Bacilli bacterium]|nr:ABC transporter ATP-binding protein [Bacilli bacterium]